EPLPAAVPSLRRSFPGSAAPSHDPTYSVARVRAWRPRSALQIPSRLKLQTQSPPALDSEHWPSQGRLSHSTFPPLPELRRTPLSPLSVVRDPLSPLFLPGLMAHPDISSMKSWASLTNFPSSQIQANLGGCLLIGK